MHSWTLTFLLCLVCSVFKSILLLIPPTADHFFGSFSIYIFSFCFPIWEPDSHVFIFSLLICRDSETVLGVFFYYSLTIPINSYLRLFWIYSIKFVMRSAAVPRSVSLVSSVVLRLKISHTQRTFSLHCHSFTVYWCQTQFHLCICVIPHNCSVCTQCVSSEQMKWWCRKGLQAVKVHLSVEGNHLFWASWPNLWFEYARQKWLKSGT